MSQNVRDTNTGNKVMECTIRSLFRCKRELAWKIEEALLPASL